MPKSLLARVRLIYFPFDVMFSLLIPLALVKGLEVKDFWYAYSVLLGIGLVRNAVVYLFLFERVFGPIGRWIESTSAMPESREVREIDSQIRRAPNQVTFWIGSLWFMQLMIGCVILLFVNPYHANIAPRSVITAALMGGATFLGTVPFTTPLMTLLLDESSRTLFALAHKAGIRLHRDRTSLQLRLVIMMACIGLAGPVWMASTSYSADAEREELEASNKAATTASDLARQIAMVDPADTAQLTALVTVAGGPGDEVSITRADGTLVVGTEPRSPPLNAWAKTLFAPLPGVSSDSTISPHDYQVAARSITPNRKLVAVVVAPITEWASSSMVWTLLAFFCVVIGWGPICAFMLARNVVAPLQDITRAVQQITEVGKLDEVAAITVSRNDETGALASRFNDLVETLRDLGSAAGALAKGDLEIRLAGEGDVAVAFRSMIESLGRIVRQIHETSVLLAAAATEIYAASQEQEAAAASQSTAMVEIRQTMESLFEAAAHVSESVRGVLSNAERTLETTDRMVVRIGDLTNHAGRIGEILETIRDISDRSDLLALNGALEASRAGEAGRGFGLVAAEMRRLAERVMSSVHDVRALVGDIRASGSSTMMATEDSKKLAASTTDAARQITLVTQQQRSGTEQVLQSVREIAETLTQSVAAMAQTRASAEQLKSQADKLSSLVRAFRIETPQA
ncbi:MAG TPA: methyl-accepting chemotaxis protein [Kofleriaceae bacterium]|nr:methyl-accepting chemotaxis protein [Kofleriaceae bacterium]